MDAAYTLTITVPSGQSPMVDYARHFCVQGHITAAKPLPDNAVLTVSLDDASGQTVRFARQTQKNNPNVYLYHPQLTAYPEQLDPERIGLLHYGFPELAVRDMSDPQQSLRDATIKCLFTDTFFKAILVTATDAAHGLIWDDGIGFTDQNADPYTVLPRGSYTLRVRLHLPDGTVLAQTQKPLTIGNQTDMAICRFNPASHRAAMTDWCHRMGVSIGNDTIPGYLDPYLGRWLYHMGLLPMYRACDIAQYAVARVHMFLYLTDPDSTSYQTELARLQEQGLVGDPMRFFAYYYDIGEAFLFPDTPLARQGRILRFEADRFLALYRMDCVTADAQENVLDLHGSTVIDTVTDLSCPVSVRAGSYVAFAGVVKPWQLDSDALTLRPDNTYEVRGDVCAVQYTFDDGETVTRETRALLLQRVDGVPIGRSVFEFYNIFCIPTQWSGKTVRVHIDAADTNGVHPNACFSLCLTVY